MTVTPKTKVPGKQAYSIAMNVVVMPVTNAETKCRRRAGMTRPVANEMAAAGVARGKLVAGLPQTPSHKLIDLGGRTIADLH